MGKADIKLGEGFFSSPCISSLRSMPGGYELIVVCLKILLAAAKSGGTLRSIGLEPTLADEVALDIDEAATDVRVVLKHLETCGRVKRISDMELMVDTDWRRME